MASRTEEPELTYKECEVMKVLLMQESEVTANWSYPDIPSNEIVLDVIDSGDSHENYTHIKMTKSEVVALIEKLERITFP